MGISDSKLGGKQYPSDGDIVCLVMADGVAVAGRVIYHGGTDANLHCFDGSQFHVGKLSSGRFSAAWAFDDARYIVLNEIAQAQRDLHYPDGDKDQIWLEEARKDGLV